MNNYQNYINQLSVFLSQFKEKEDEIDKYNSRKFSVYDYIYFGENKISDIFCDLLDCEGVHGQKSLFFVEFLKKLFPEKSALMGKIKLLNEKIKPTVTREYRTDRIENYNRRIDLIIQWNNEFGIGIENKPFDRDQENQLSDYSKQLKKNFKDFVLVYISEADPTEYSISNDKLNQLILENNYIKLDYSTDIIDWLNSSKSKCTSPKVNFFLEDVINKFNIHFNAMGKITTEKTDEIVKFTLLSEQNIESSFDVFHSFQAVLTQIARNFIDNIKQKMENANEGIIVEHEIKNNNRINIQVRKDNWKEGVFCCIETEDNDSIFFGIWDENEHLDFEKIQIRLIENGSILKHKSSGKWVWWSYPESKYQNWQQSAEKLSSMQSKETVDYYFYELKNLMEIVEFFQ